MKKKTSWILPTIAAIVVSVAGGIWYGFGDQGFGALKAFQNGGPDPLVHLNVDAFDGPNSVLQPRATHQPAEQKPAPVQALQPGVISARIRYANSQPADESTPFVSPAVGHAAFSRPDGHTALRATAGRAAYSRAAVGTATATFAIPSD